jgi:hypothetical protein
MFSCLGVEDIRHDDKRTGLRACLQASPHLSRITDHSAARHSADLGFFGGGTVGFDIADRWQRQAASIAEDG